MSQTQGYSYQWEDTIQNDSEFTVLPEGEYGFEVVKFERGRHTPGPEGKLPPCNKAVLTIKATAPDGRSAQIIHNLYLHSSVEGLLCAFFIAIGQRKHGEKLTMNWNKVTGARGRCRIIIDTWKGTKNDREMQSNKITRFLPPAESPEAAAPAFEPGRF